MFLALILSFNLVLFQISQSLSAGQQDDKPLAKWLEEARTFCETQCQPPSNCDHSQCQIAYLSGRAASESRDSSPSSGPEPNGVHEYDHEPNSDGGPHQNPKRTGLTFQPSGKGYSGSKLEGAEYERTKKLCEDVCPECTLEECTDMFVSGMAYGSKHKREIEQNIPVKVSKTTDSHFTSTADTPNLNSPPDSKSGAQEESSKPAASYMAGFKKNVLGMCANRFPKVDPKVCQGIFIAGMSVTGGVAAVLFAPYALAAAGFSAAGVAAHSFGAFLMSVATQWGVGGALIAALQSAGAAGVGFLTGLVGSIGGAIAGYFW